MQNFWSQNHTSLDRKVSDLAYQLREWNKEIFGEIFKQKKIIIRGLAGIQQAVDKNNNRFLIKLKSELQNQLGDILKREEDFWLSKSRLNWTTDGDKNTRFFHLTTVIRRRRNKLEGLFDENNVWHIEKNKMNQIATQYFQELFKES